MFNYIRRIITSITHYQGQCDKATEYYELWKDQLETNVELHKRLYRDRTVARHYKGECIRMQAECIAMEERMAAMRATTRSTSTN